MMSSPTSTMQTIWLCVAFFLGLVSAHRGSRAFDLASLKRDTNTGSFLIPANRNPAVQRSGPGAKLRALAKYGVNTAAAEQALANNKGVSE